MPGSIRSMQLEHVLRNVQTDRGSLLHGRLLRWQFDTVTLAHRCRRGASTPSPNSAGPSHPLQTSIDVASLAPNAEITVFPWREPPELKARTINRVRTFLKSQIPMRAAAQ